MSSVLRKVWVQCSVSSLLVAVFGSGCFPLIDRNTAQTTPQPTATQYPYPPQPNQPAPYPQPTYYPPNNPTNTPAPYTPPTNSPTPPPTPAPSPTSTPPAPTGTAALPTPFPFPIPGMPSNFPFPFPTPTASPTSPPAPTPGPAPSAVCSISSTPQTFRTSAQLSQYTGVCNQQPKLSGNLTIRATSPTSVHLDWNGGEHSDDASFDAPSCTITRNPPGKSETQQGVTGRATYRITIDSNNRLSGTAHVNVDIPFAPCQADYNVSGAK